MPETDGEALAGTWLRFAREDLETAAALLEAGRPARQVVFFSQQAAEKALKAVLVRHQREFEFTHDLERLAEALPVAVELPETQALASLSRWAVVARYPNGDDPDEAEAREATEVARAVLAGVEAALGEGGVG